jgi:hypothetical protein
MNILGAIVLGAALLAMNWIAAASGVCMAMATIVGTRSGLFFKTNPGGLPSIIDGKTFTGNVFFVDSAVGTDSAGYGLHPDAPFATLDFAVGQCTANQGDVIFVLPGHAETIIADSGVDIDVAGVTVIGLGKGAARPTFTFTTNVGADFKLAAANVRAENILFVAGIDALTGPIEVSAADCAVIDCEYRDDDDNSYETTDVLVTTTAADRILVDNFKYVHDGGSGGTQIQSVILLAVVDQPEIRNCFIICDGANGGIEAGAATQVNIHDNRIESTHTNDVCITLASTTTGMVYRNFCKIATDAQTSWITADNDCGLFENYGVNVDAESGVLIGTPSS